MAGKRTISAPGVIVVFNDGEVGAMLHGPDGEVAQDIQRRSYAVQKRMKRLAPRWSGALERGIHAEFMPAGSMPGVDGPASRVVSDAPHTIVAEIGRRHVIASGAPGGGVRSRGRGARVARTDLRWGTDHTGAPRSLTIRLTPGGGVLLRRRAGPADGSHFMERSIDAAVD